MDEKFSIDGRQDFLFYMAKHTIRKSLDSNKKGGWTMVIDAVSTLALYCPRCGKIQKSIPVANHRWHLRIMLPGGM